jgi:hypothetical protein
MEALPPPVQLDQLNSVPVAVVRRQANASELPRVVRSAHWQSEWNANPSQIRTDVYYLLTS